MGCIQSSHTWFESLTGGKGRGTWGFFKIRFPRWGKGIEGEEGGLDLKTVSTQTFKNTVRVFYIIEIVRGGQILELFLTQSNDIFTGNEIRG